MSNSESKPKLSHKFKKGDLVVFKNICSENCLYSDHLHEVKKVVRWSDYLEIRETLCRHSNRRAWGSDGSDIRHATNEEIRLRTRLPKTIYGIRTKVVFINPKSSFEILETVHYTQGNSLLIADKHGSESEVEIFDIREATEEEIAAACSIIGCTSVD